MGFTSNLCLLTSTSDLVTFPARAHFPEVRPRVDPQIVVVVPGKPQRVFSYGLGRKSLDRRLEHRQCSRSRFLKLTRLPSALTALILTKRARTSVAQEPERIRRPVPVFPLNLQALARGQMHLYRLRIVRYPRRRISYSHASSIARRESGTGLRIVVQERRTRS